MPPAMRERTILDDLKVIDFDSEKFGKFVFDYIGSALSLEYVMSSEIKVYGRPDDPIFVLLKNGTKIIDAVLAKINDSSKVTYLTPVISVDDSEIATSIRDFSILVVYIMLRGDYPNEGVQLPKILVHYGVDTSIVAKSRNLCSLELKRLPLHWIRHIPLNNLPVKVKNRLMLGMPGYRLINAIRLIKVDYPEYNQFQGWFVKTFAGFHWDVVTFTRSDEFIATFPDFSRNLMSFMAVAYEHTKLEEMVSTKVIFSMPESDVRYQAWRNWPSLSISFKDKIEFVNE